MSPWLIAVRVFVGLSGAVPILATAYIRVAASRGEPVFADDLGTACFVGLVFMYYVLPTVVFGALIGIHVSLSRNRLTWETLLPLGFLAYIAWCLAFM